MSEMSDLFAKDPLKLTKEDRAQIIAHYRDNRAKWKSAGTSAKPKAEKAPVPPGGLSLDDLGL